MVGLPEDAIDAGEVEELVGRCGSFLLIQGDTVYFVHQSAKDFLRSVECLKRMLPGGIEDGHRLLAKDV
jgi:hypothetical protein